MIKLTNVSDELQVLTHSHGIQLHETLDLKMLYDWDVQRLQSDQDIGEEHEIQHMLENDSIQMHAKAAMKKTLNILQIEKKDMKAIYELFELLTKILNIRDQANLID